MANRPSWKGTIGFGMVSVPVKLYPATEEKAIRFTSIHRKCQTRIQMPRWCPTCNGKVEASELVKGYEVGDKQYVLLEETDFAALPLKSLKSIEVVEFVDGSKIDARHYEKSYFVAPEDAGVKAFSLFLQAMAQVNLVGICKLVRGDKEHLATIRAFGRVILLNTLFYSEELRNAADVQVKLSEVSEREMQMAITLIKTLVSDTVDLTKYHDRYRDALMQVIQAKVSGQPLTVQAPKEEQAVDLFDTLMASINAEQKKKETAGAA